MSAEEEPVAVVRIGFGDTGATPKKGCGGCGKPTPTGRAPKTPIPCRHVGPDSGPKGWHYCEHPNPSDDPRIPSGDVVCGAGCNGKCTPRCPGYTVVSAAVGNGALATDSPVGRKHLVYHLMPVHGNGAWQWNVDELRRRWSLFDGHKVVAVTTGYGGKSRLDPPSVVRAYLPDGCEVLEIPNDPRLREVATWESLWSAVLPRTNPEDAVLYAHAKGVTRGPETTATEWAAAMYEVMLDRPDLTDSALRRHPIAGCFRRVGTRFRGSGSAWHYSGAFFWVRAGDFASRRWRDVEHVWYGNEAWPGTAYGVGESASLFLSEPADARDLDPYKPELWGSLIRPRLEGWRSGG